MTPSEIEAHVGSTDFERVRRMLAGAFRSGVHREPVDDETVARSVEAEWTARIRPRPAGDPARVEPAFSFLAAPPPGWTPAPAPAPAGAVAYYEGEARHERSVNEAPQSIFVGVLPMVRVSLPLDPPPAGLIADTAIGQVVTQDHLLTSVSAVRDHLTAKLGPAFADVSRVDLVTPARVGARFGAIGLYLGYRGGTTPSFYVLEAGLASGPSVRLFISPDLSKIVDHPTAYRPTPFTQMSNSYDGQLTLDGDHPSRLVVQSFREPRLSVGWRVQVTVKYVLKDAATVAHVAPADLTLMAAERIAAIGRARGDNAIDLQDLLATAGEKLDWIQRP